MRNTLILAVALSTAACSTLSSNNYDLPKFGPPKVEFVSTQPVADVTRCINSALHPENPQIDHSQPFQAGRVIHMGGALISIQPQGEGSHVSQWDGHFVDVYRTKTRSCA